MTFVLFILIFGIVVISHEWGHFLLARAGGIHVVEFAIGMGPTLWSTQRGDTKFSIKLLPIGGACMFEGEDGLVMEKEEGRGADSPGSFLRASVWKRISCVLAGPVFNFILAFIIAAFMVQYISIVEPVVTEVTEGSAAQEAGLQAGDRILSIDGERVFLFDEIVLHTMTARGKAMSLRYEREGRAYEASVTPRLDEASGRYYMGVIFGQTAEEKGISRLKYAYYEMRYSVKATYKSLFMLVTGKLGRQDVAGPVGIAVNVVGKTYETAKEYGWESVVLSMMNITLLLSVNLGVMNLLPLPALDGGRLVFLLLEAVRGKPIPPEKEGMVHMAGLVFFMALMVLILFNDLANIFA